MKSEDKEAFEKWFASLNDYHLSRVIKLNRGASQEAWQAACLFKQKEIDDLKQKLEAAEACIDCFYEATKKVGW